MFFQQKTTANHTTSAMPANQSDDLQHLKTWLQDLCNGNLTAQCPTIHSAELLPLQQLMEKFTQNQAKNLLDISMEINAAVYEETNASEILNRIVTEYKEITLNINAIVDVVQQMADAINDLAATASETARQ